MKLLNLTQSYRGMVIFTGLVVMLVSSVNAGTVTLAMAPFPPFVLDSSDSPGWFQEIVTTALKKQGYEVDVKILPFIRSMQYTETGAYDALAPVYRTPQREKEFVFSVSLGATRTILIQRQGQGIRYHRLSDLKPYTIGMVRGTSISPEFDSADYLKKELVNWYVQNIKLLKTGRIDLAAGNELVFLTSNRKMIETFPQPIEVLEPELASHKHYVAFSKKAPKVEQLVLHFNRGVEKMKAEGIYQHILKKYGLKLCKEFVLPHQDLSCLIQ